MECMLTSTSLYGVPIETRGVLESQDTGEDSRPDAGGGEGREEVVSEAVGF
jgi:hypothetical protein